MNLSLLKQPMTLPDYYTTHCREYHEKTFHIDPSPFLMPFAESLQPGAHVFDIGCGSGRDLLWLTKKGFQATGFESSAGLAALARQNSGCKVIKGNFETYDFSILQADALLLSGAMVHLAHHRLEPVLKNILQALPARTEAIVYLSIKEGQGSFTDQQNRTFYLWQDKDIRGVFQKTGLEVIHFLRTPSVLGTGEAWLGYVLKKGALK